MKLIGDYNSGYIYVSTKLMIIISKNKKIISMTELVLTMKH